MSSSNQSSLCIHNRHLKLSVPKGLRLDRQTYIPYHYDQLIEAIALFQSQTRKISRAQRSSRPKGWGSLGRVIYADIIESCISKSRLQRQEKIHGYPPPHCVVPYKDATKLPLHFPNNALDEFLRGHQCKLTSLNTLVLTSPGKSIPPIKHSQSCSMLILIAVHRD